MELVVETGAGAGASFTDEAYQGGRRRIADDMGEAMGAGDIVLKVQRPLPDEGALEGDEARRGADRRCWRRCNMPTRSPAYAQAGVAAFAMELVPRITRAQSMDVLSSQSNLAGYRITLEAVNAFGRALPMMMTAAGTIPPARVLVMGAGVAGLQAIATARRLGAIVSATDVRLAAKEQVESLGASFLAVDLDAMKAMETAGGYAKEMGADFARRQREHVAEAMKKTDIVICTALVPGRKAPVLITAAMVGVMKPGSVIVDLAVEQGGNVEGSKPGETVVTPGGVSILGPLNVPSHIPVDSSQLYAKNLVAFLGLIIDKDKHLKIDLSDEIVKATLLTLDGAVVHPQFAAQPVSAAGA